MDNKFIKLKERRYVACKFCGRLYIRYDGNNLYCSRKCRIDLFRKKQYKKYKHYHKRKCVNCDEMFIPCKETHSFCSDECRKEIRKLKLNDIDLREYLLEKTNFTCEICKERNTELYIHHKKPLYDYGKDEIDNLQVLCDSCHILEHKKYYKLKFPKQDKGKTEKEEKKKKKPDDDDSIFLD